MREFEVSDRLVHRIEWTMSIVLAVQTMGAWVFFSAGMALGVFLGGVIASLSFEVLKWQLRRALMRPGRLPGKAGLFASYYLRYLVTMFIVFLVIYNGWANPIALLVGLSVVTLSIIVVGGLEFLLVLADKGEG